jgi:hypothetical protein
MDKNAPTCFYFMSDFLPIPERFVNQALDIAQHWQDHLDSLVNRPSITFKDQESRFTPPPGKELATKPYVEFDGTIASARQQPRLQISNEWEQWLREHITDRFTDTGVSTSVVSPGENHKDSHAGTMHSDGVRKFCLFYILKKSNDDQWTRWYRPKDGPLINTTSANGVAGQYLALDQEEFILIDEICMPTNVWIYTDVRILHQATNHQGERIAIHVSFQEDVFGMFRHNDELNKEYI